MMKYLHFLHKQNSYLHPIISYLNFYKIPLAIITINLLLFFNFLLQYFITDFIIWAALLLTVYIIKPDKSPYFSLRYFGWSIIFGFLAFLTGVQTFYFFAIGFAIWYAIESYWGNIGHLPLFLLGLLSPTFKYFNNMLGFPIRLKLSEWVGNILQFMGMKIEVIGNIIIMNNTEFSVDPACVGLKMTAISVLSGLLIMAFYQRQTNSHLRFGTIILILVSIIILNIFSNLNRILLLTIFSILPENPQHDIIGMLCLLVYVILPTYFIIGKVFKHKIFIAGIKEIVTKHSNIKVYTNLLLVVCLVFTGFYSFRDIQHQSNSTPHVNIYGYTQEVVNNDIIKLQKEGILIYIKPMSRFYGAEHNPMICWTGSGYQFKQIKTQKIKDTEIYTGTLIKGKDKIHSAWWFDTGSYQTISQTDWRWKAFKGENFYLININSEDKNILEKEIINLLNNNISITNKN